MSGGAQLLSAALLLTLSGVARAERPTEPGQSESYSSTDVLAHLDDPTGAVRVHYSVEGPNKTLLEDADIDGFPDFPQDIASTAVDVLAFYETELGLRAPITEAQMGLGNLGGSGAFDFYLVDFGGSSDGHFGVDACSEVPLHCGGHLIMENDFAGYGYPNLGFAVDVLTSHELFHGVQAAYDGEMPVWVMEGTAVWGELRYDPTSMDFFWFVDAYFDDTGRSIDRPPPGPVPAFAYSTALWWDFLSLRHDNAIIEEILSGLERTSAEPVDALATLQTVLESRGDTLEAAWSTFSRWNLATGRRSGIAESYPYADQIGVVRAEAQGAAIDDENRFYPLAATYYHISHEGGPLWFGLDEGVESLWFALFQVSDGGTDGPVNEPVLVWEGNQAGAFAFADGADLPAGGYWLAGAYSTVADNSVRVRLCLGTEEVATACAPLPDTGDTGLPPHEGCGCSSMRGTASGLGILALLGALAIRRRS